jgi:hypothetical protein
LIVDENLMAKSKPKDTISSNNSIWKEAEDYKFSERGSLVASSDFDLTIEDDEDEVEIEKSSGRSSTIYS